jgi:hypothetical protein
MNSYPYDASGNSIFKVSQGGQTRTYEMTFPAFLIGQSTA